MKLSKAMNGAIPGENYLADTKNYPWHRPPEMADYVEIVEALHKRISAPEQIGRIKVMLAAGETILEYVTGMLRIAVGEGKIPIDMAVLAAGPFARMVESIAEQGNFEFERGWKQQVDIPTVSRLRALAGISGEPDVPKIPEELNAKPVEVPQAAGGFMDNPEGPAPKDEQMKMLGQTE